MGGEETGVSRENLWRPALQTGVTETMYPAIRSKLRNFHCSGDKYVFQPQHYWVPLNKHSLEVKGKM